MIFNSTNKKFFLNIIIVCIIFILDRISKEYIINLSENSSGFELFSSSFLNILLVWNEGIAFGLLSFSDEYIYNFITAIIALVITIIFVMTLNSHGIKRFSFLLILGGALGNLYDRIYFQAVPDFIDFYIGELHWFIFNVADIFISGGVVLLILFEIFSKKQKYKND